MRALTAHDALAAWDRGDVVWTVEMGGVGPGYEQALQILVWEIIRDGGKHEAAVMRAGPGVGGFSGAQVGAARTLAGAFLERGYAQALAEVPQDRWIMVSRSWPRPPEVTPS